MVFSVILLASTFTQYSSAFGDYDFISEWGQFGISILFSLGILFVFVIVMIGLARYVFTREVNKPFRDKVDKKSNNC
jgi:ABC-type transport system involved in multi-copper enzyme maturation permease subunit